MNPGQEKQLIEQCRADAAAFGQVFDLWYKPVFGYIMRRTADYDVSKDIAAETFLKAFLKINGFQWRGISLSAWLYRIATNELNQLLIGLAYTIIGYISEAGKRDETVN